MLVVMSANSEDINTVIIKFINQSVFLRNALYLLPYEKLVGDLTVLFDRSIVTFLFLFGKGEVHIIHYILVKLTVITSQ